jgi:hypothetical protein
MGFITCNIVRIGFVIRSIISEVTEIGCNNGPFYPQYV